MTSSIISYFPIKTPPTISGPTNYGPLVNHRFGRTYTMTAGADSAAGLRIHDTWPNGNELTVRTKGQIPVQLVGGLFPVWTLTYNTQVIAFTNGASNSESVTYARQRDLSFAGYFGIENSDSDPSGGVRWIAPGQMVAIQDSKKHDFLIATTITASSEINCLNVSKGLCVRLGPMTETRAKLGAVPDGSGFVAYAIGYQSPNGTHPLTLYSVTPVAAVIVGTVAPSAIDVTWSHIDNVWGVAIDQTDGNPIIAVNDETDAPTNRSYLVKLNKQNAHVIWKYIIPGPIGFSDGDLQQALITKQRFYYMTTDKRVAVINTDTGVQVSIAAFGDGALSANHPAQISEDVTGSVYYMGGWSENATHPNYYGSYMGTGGHHAITNAPIRYFPDTGAPNPPTPPIISSSRQRAWTFTLDGHKFYVLDLGTQGTLLYDTTTGSWSQFVTVGYFNWNFRNGTTWGQRIIGGDTDIPQLWEMSPSSLKDNDTLDITHISTGALIKRTRTFTSVAAVRLSVSVGLLDDETGADILLEFSDDQGQTWTAMNTVNLVDDDFTQEIAWQGLGSFAAPGRIFRITDVGGFLRIDGCDAELNDFDEDSNEETQSP